MAAPEAPGWKPQFASGTTPAESAHPEFARHWTATIIERPPLIAPARHYIWPHAITGEEDALARGALRVMVRPAAGAGYLLTCALGFSDASMPSGVFAVPNPDEICVVAGGYAYLAPAARPEECTLLALKPVAAVHLALEARLLLFIGFQSVVAWGTSGFAWQSGRLSWEGVRLTSVGVDEARGFGWDMISDREVEFVLDLERGTHRGGGYLSMGEPCDR